MRRFLADEKGVTAIEYALIAVGMGLALITVMPNLAASVTSHYASIGSHIVSGK